MEILTMPLNEQYQPMPQIQPLPPTRSDNLCNNLEQDKFLPDDGYESSIVLDLKPGKTINSCKRFFAAPEPSGLFVRLVKGDNSTRRNLTESCPLSIVSNMTLTLKVIFLCDCLLLTVNIF